MKFTLITLAAILAPCAAVVGCTFPVIEVVGSGGKSSTGATSTSPSGTGATTTTTSVTSGTTNTSATATSASASSGMGPNCPCLMTTNCDCDGDGVERFDMTHGCMNVPNDLTMSDCNDCDPTIHVGQMGFFPTAGPNGFDYNCDGSLEQKWVEGNCSAFVDGLSGECAKHTYLEVSGACGAMVPVVTCKGTGIPTAPCGTNPAVMQPLPCH